MCSLVFRWLRTWVQAEMNIKRRTKEEERDEREKSSNSYKLDIIITSLKYNEKVMVSLEILISKKIRGINNILNIIKIKPILLILFLL